MRHWDTCGSWLFDKTVKKLGRVISWYLCWQKLIVCRDWSIWSTWWAWLCLSWASHSDYEPLLSMVLRLRPRPLQKASPNPRQHGDACAIATLVAPARTEAGINEIKLHSETLWSLPLPSLLVSNSRLLVHVSTRHQRAAPGYWHRPALCQETFILVKLNRSKISHEYLVLVHREREWDWRL